MATGGEEAEPRLYIIAIDLGIKFSAFGFSSNIDFQKDRWNIKRSVWSKPNNHLSHKTPTSIYLNPDKTKVLFGSEADKTYKKLNEGELTTHYYFKEFTKNIKDVCTDAKGKKLPVTDIIGLSVKSLKDKLFHHFGLQEKDKIISRYYVTLPATSSTFQNIYNIGNEIAIKADIEQTHLSIMTQDEAKDNFFSIYNEIGTKDPVVEMDKKQNYSDGGNIIILKGAVLLGHERTPLPKVFKMKSKTVSGEPKKETEEDDIKINPEALKLFMKNVEKKYHYNEEGNVEVTTEMLENGLGINTKADLCFKEPLEEEIVQDTRDIIEMIKYAKYGLWEKVWEILKRKPHIVNCIPENSSLSVLHQAIFWLHIQEVKTLVEEFDADVNIFTKSTTEEEGGVTAKQFANREKRPDISNYLEKHMLLQERTIKCQDISQFTIHDKGTIYPFQEYPLFQLTIASYKTIFSNNKSFKGNKMAHISQITNHIFKCFDKTWKDAAKKIYNTIYGLGRNQSEYLISSICKKTFFEKIIRLYTENSVYHHVHSALRRQHRKPYKPLGTDLAVAPFALTLSAILIHFEDLEPYSGITYRGVVDENVVDQYKVGTTIIFFSFMSSSTDINVAKKFAGDRGTLFILHNFVDRKWLPRSISHLSRFPNEKECLFSFGAQFEVVRVDKSRREVTLRLLRPKV